MKLNLFSRFTTQAGANFGQPFPTEFVRLMEYPTTAPFDESCFPPGHVNPLSDRAVAHNRSDRQPKHLSLRHSQPARL